MRTYAVWSKNKFILIGLGAIALTCVVLDCVRFVTFTAIAFIKSSADLHIQLHVPGLRCTGSSSIQMYVACCHHLSIRTDLQWNVSRVSANTLLSILVCIFEFLSTSLTLFRCVQSLRVGGSRTSQKGTFHYVIAEQGENLQTDYRYVQTV